MSETKITQLGRVMVPVADQDTAIAFYTDKLGFEVRADTPFGDGDRWVEVAPPGGASAFALVPERENYAVGRNLGVALESEDIDADHATLRERGVDVDAEILRMGGGPPPMFWFRDQDANILLLVGAQPV
jgi:catechol 2,3-dioxygenase-like lactoylglutathione lyase family enzyme